MKVNNRLVTPSQSEVSERCNHARKSSAAPRPRKTAYKPLPGLIDRFDTSGGIRRAENGSAADRQAIRRNNVLRSVLFVSFWTVEELRTADSIAQIEMLISSSACCGRCSWCRPAYRRSSPGSCRCRRPRRRWRRPPHGSRYPCGTRSGGQSPRPGCRRRS